MNVVELIGQRATLSERIENEINDIQNKYARNKFYICFHNHYAGGVISIFKHPESANYKTYEVEDKKSGYIIKFEIDKVVENLYPKALNDVIKKITGEEYGRVKK